MEKIHDNRAFLLKALLVGLAAVIPFLPAVNSPLIFDDMNTIVQNPAMESIDIPRYFSDRTAFSVKPGNWPYRPALMLINSIQYNIFGENPVPWHLFQIAVHALNSILVLFLATRFMKMKTGAPVAALLFAAAPIQTQAAVYVSARAMVMAAPFVLGALLASVKAAEDEKPQRWIFLAGALSALAFFTAEGAVALVFFIPLTLWASGADLKAGKTWIAPGTAAALAAVFVLVRHLLSPESAPVMRLFSPYENALVQLGAPLKMAGLFLWPPGLSFLHEADAPGSIFEAGPLMSIAFIVFSLILAFALRKTRPLAAGILWHLAALLPSVMVNLNIAYAEHRSYIASIGLCLFIGAALERIFFKEEKTSTSKTKAARLLIAVIVALLALTSFSRAMVWRSPVSVYVDAAEKDPGSFATWNFLAMEEFNRGECGKSIAYSKIAARLHPGFADAYNTGLACLYREGKYNQALDLAREAVRLHPDNPTYWGNLGTVLMGLQRWEEARNALVTALEKSPPDEPNLPVFRRNLMKLEKILEREKGRSPYRR